MKSVSIKEFQKNIYLYINDLPVRITRRGVGIAVLQAPYQEVATTPDKRVISDQVTENKEESVVTTKVTTQEDYEIIYD